MEIGRRCRGPRDNHVVFCGELEKPLDACRRVVGALPFETVGEEKDNTRALTPFLFSRGNEFVDDGLCTVDKVTELRFPHDECIGALHRVAILESEGRVFTQKRVIKPQACLVFCHVHQRQPLLTVLPVVKDGVPLHERSAPGVLADQTNRGAFQQE